MKTRFILFCLCISTFMYAQVGIGTNSPNQSAKFEVVSTSQGVLFPRMTAAQRDAITNPAQGLMVYQTDGTIGLYHFDGTNWRNLATGFIPTATGQAASPNMILTNIDLFGSPQFVTVDHAGNLYFTDLNQHRIQKVTPDGTITTVAGSGIGFADGPGNTAKFNFPSGIVVDANGNIIVADKGNNRIRKIAPDGTVSTLAGMGTAGLVNGSAQNAQFNLPMGIAIGNNGVLYVSDYGNNMIRTISTSGSVNNVFISSYSNLNPGVINGPVGIVVDALGNIFFANLSSHSITKISASGVLSNFTGQPAVPGFVDGSTFYSQFSVPYGLAMDGTGNLYVTEQGNRRVRKVSPDGYVTTIAGTGNFNTSTTSGPPLSVPLNQPAGIAIDDNGQIFFADQGRIRKIKY